MPFRHRTSPRRWAHLGALAGLLTASALAVAGPATAASGTIRVTQAGDHGPGTFRAAVATANLDPSIRKIELAGGLTVGLESAVEFSGAQDLVIDGHGSTLSGAGVTPDTDTWDSGLFVATGGGDLAISKLTLADSFNNGLAVFLPEGTGTVSVSLDRVAVVGAQFHGILIDGQSTSGFNTDDVLHLACTDPYPVDSGVGIEVNLSKSLVTGAGRIAGYDTTLATGCPQDFDGLRVDQGGNGDITGTLAKSAFVGNLADGTELDETGDGAVDVVVTGSTFSDNGDTSPVLCDVPDVGCDLGDLVTDLDDGFDIDETGEGDLVVVVSNSQVDGNFDEGLDFDEADGGDLVATVDRVTASGNNDEAFKASEVGDGDNFVALSRCTFLDGDDDGATVEEEDAGTIAITVDRCRINGNSKYGISADEDDAGADGTLRVTRSDLSGNAKGELDLDDVDLVG